MNNKFIKIIGNVVTVLAIVFLFNKMLAMEIDYEILFAKENLIFLIIFSLLYGIHIYLVCISWKTIIHILTGKVVSFASTSLILCKSNLLKYIPGNVFQYVGRNELAIKENLKHSDVALSTVIDISCNVIGVFLLALICYSNGFVKIFDEYGSTIIQVLIGGMILLLIAILALYYFMKDKLICFFKKFQVFTDIKNIKRIAYCLLYYTWWGIYTGLIYIAILHYILGMQMDLNMVLMILGAFLFSWILGFIMPGAPGGIGIREASITLLLGISTDINVVLLGIIIYRLINILGDLVGLCLAKITNRIAN